MSVLFWLVTRALRLGGGSSRLPVLALAGLLTACGVWGAYALAGWYWDRLAENAAWVDAAPVERASRLVGTLFERAVSNNLIAVEAGPERLGIRPPPCAERLSPLPATPDVPDAAKRKKLLDLLCTTLQGAEIAAEIRQWNASFHFLAVRDDRGREAPCGDGTPPHHAYLEAGCKPTRWQARRITPSGSFVVETPTGAAPPQRDFSMIAAERRRGANDWLMIAPDAIEFEPLEQQSYRLSSRLAFSGLVTVDLIGRPLAVSIDGETRTIDPEQGMDSEQVGPVALSIDRLCEDGNGSACTSPPKPGHPHAFALNLRSDAPVEIVLSFDAAPLRIVPERLRAQKGLVRLRRSAHIEVTCTGSDCTLTWAPIVTVEARRPGRHAILTREGGTSLVDESGRITAEALDLGLAPVIGLGPQDAGSLTASLAASGGREDRRIALTIDRTLQAAAVEGLTEALTCPPEDPGPRKSRRACQENPERRAALVLMDAESAPGEILAMASWPPMETGLNIWDVLALEAGGSNLSPVAGHAWRASDRHNLPGSTFKVVTALAAAEAALSGNEEMATLLRESNDLRGTAQALDLKHRPSQSGCTPIDPAEATVPAGQRKTRPDYDTRAVPNRDGSSYFCVQNPSNVPFAHAWLKPSQSGCPSRRAGDTPQIGVCEALLTSSNLYFAGLALRLDGEKVIRERGGEEVEIVEALPDLALAAMARRLFPDRPFDLLRGQGPRVDRLMAEPMVLDAVRPLAPGDPRRVRVALAGYGQSVRATGLAIANVFASLANGGIVRPRLVRRDPARPESASPDEGEPLLGEGRAAGPDGLLSLIRAGLEGTAMSPVGTAHGQFARPKPSRLLRKGRLYVKTGTADVKDADARGPRLYSSWLAGWVEGDPDGGIRRRLAFACWKSHSVEAGAAACGPIIRRLLEKLDAGGDQ